MEVLTSKADLHALAPEWQALWRADPGATPFQSPDWLIPWWEHVGEGDLHLLTVRESARETLLALVPLYIYAQPATGERHLLLLGAGTSDYLDGIFHSDITPSLALSALQHLTSARRSPFTPPAQRWDRVFLSQLRDGSPLLTAARKAGWKEFEAEPCSVVDVSGRDELPSKLRGNLNRYARRARSEGSLSLNVATTPQAAAASLDGLVSLHTRRWRGRGEAGVLASPRIQAHHRAAISGLQAAGQLALFDLRLNGHTIAVLYALRDLSRGAPTRDTDALFLYLIGFDPDYAELSPGTLLLSAVFDHCVIAGIPRMDLLRGGEVYKQHWGARTVATYGVTLPE